MARLVQQMENLLRIGPGLVCLPALIETCHCLHVVLGIMYGLSGSLITLLQSLVVLVKQL